MKKTPPKSAFKQKVDKFQGMVKSDKKLSSSYKEEMFNKADSIVSTFTSSLPVKPKDFTKVVGDINKQRLSKIKKTEAYKALSKNPSISETGVGRTVKHYEEKIMRGKNPIEYQIPKTSEIQKIIKLGEVSSSESNFTTAVVKNPIKSAGAYLEMQKVRKNYASMDSIAKKQIKRINSLNR
jgi:hypothetical protein